MRKCRKTFEELRSEWLALGRFWLLTMSYDWDRMVFGNIWKKIYPTLLYISTMIERWMGRIDLCQDWFWSLTENSIRTWKQQSSPSNSQHTDDTPSLWGQYPSPILVRKESRWPLVLAWECISLASYEDVVIQALSPSGSHTILPRTNILLRTILNHSTT